MSKYSVTHSCGHDSTHQLFGKTSGFGGRESRVSWLETQPCLSCKSKMDQELREAQSREAAVRNELDGTIPLTGSEKQVEWAETIRRQVLDTFREAKSPNPEITGLMESTIAWLRLQSESKWWIETIGTLTSREGFAPIFALIDGKKSPPSKPEILRAVLLESPTISETSADLVGLGDSYRAKISARAAAAARAETVQQVEASKPHRPDFVFEGTPDGAKWNLKIYSGRRIFVGNKEIKMTPEQEKELQKYISDRRKWNEEMESIK